MSSRVERFHIMGSRSLWREFGAMAAKCFCGKLYRKNFITSFFPL